MRELERSSHLTPGPIALAGSRLAIVGRGRLATALADAFTQTLPGVSAPLGREPDLSGYDVVLLCVPDAAIAGAARRRTGRRRWSVTAPGRLRSTALGDREGFSLHPLMSVPAGSGAARLRGAPAAVAGSTPRALAIAEDLATAAAMRPFAISDDDRGAYHAAASVASNFLVTLQGRGRADRRWDRR